MSDRELLELAAKAAGLTDYEWDDGSASMVKCVVRIIQGDDTTTYEILRWNPRTDDGDALRLAVKLGIGLAGSESHVWACKLDICDIHEPIGSDPCAATRRAIVRAAAEIGKARPGGQT